MARMAGYWDVPIFTAGGFDASFSEKTIYSTLTRLSFSLDRVSHFLIQIFRENEWHHVSLIVDESDPNMALVRKSLALMFKVESTEHDYEISLNIETIEPESRNRTLDYVHCLQQGAKISRGLLISYKISLPHLCCLLSDALDDRFGYFTRHSPISL